MASTGKKNCSNGTISEIASLAGVSKTTVSLVLNGKARENRTSVETEKKIKDIIQKLGYVPSQFARSFRKQATNTLGLVLADINNNFFSSLAKVIEQSALKRNYSIIIMSTEDNPALEDRAVSSLLSRAVDGLLVSSIQKTDTLSAQLASRAKPLVYFDRLVGHSQSPCVSTDNHRGGFELTTHYLNRGARSFAFIGGISYLSTNQQRYAGFLDALSGHGLGDNPRLVMDGDFSVQSGYRCAERLFTEGTALPDVVITASFTLLEGVFRYLGTHQEIATGALRFATFDNHFLLDFLRIPVCSVEQDCETMGAKACDMLIDKIEGREVTESIVIAPKVICRD